MQGLHAAESITGSGVDVVDGTSPGIIFTGVDHIRSPRGYMSSASPPAQPPLKCPRCDSTNTKFCYYNNYNLSQPRHFCKSCRRYWTKGGVLRNVPVGGGCRKTKRASSSKSSKSTSDKNCKRSTAAARSPSDTSTVTSVDPSNTDHGMIVSETCGPELPNQLIAPSMGDLEFSLPDPITLRILNESKEPTDKTKPDDSAQTVETDFLPGFQGLLSSDRVLAFSGLDWSLPVDQTLFDLSTGTVDVGSFWNQNNWGDAAADPALYLP